MSLYIDSQKWRRKKFCKKCEYVNAIIYIYFFNENDMYWCIEWKPIIMYLKIVFKIKVQYMSQVFIITDISYLPIYNLYIINSNGINIFNGMIFACHRFVHFCKGWNKSKTNNWRKKSGAIPNCMIANYVLLKYL